MKNHVQLTSVGLAQARPNYKALTLIDTFS